MSVTLAVNGQKRVVAVDDDTRFCGSFAMKLA
jgi:hypothetical protein